MPGESQPKPATSDRPSPAKALKARIECDLNVRRALWEMHELFHVLVADLTDRLWEMRRGRPHPACRDLLKIMLKRGSQSGSFAILEPLTRPDWKPGKTHDWTVLVGEIRKALPGGVLFDRRDWHIGDLTIAVGAPRKKSARDACICIHSEFWRKACEMAVQLIHTYDELKANWRKDRDDWIDRREEWLAEHPDFAAAWGRFEAFEKLVAEKLTGKHGAKIRRDKSGYGKRFARWHLFYEWLTAPEQHDLVAWRKKAAPADFVPVPDGEVEEITAAQKRQDRVVFALLDRLRALNPELDQLLELRGSYVRDFIRFRRPPTWTRPSPEKHPAWFTFKEGESYREIDPENGAALFKIQPAEPGEKPYWAEIRFTPDPRMKPSYRQRRGLAPFIEITGNKSWALFKRAREGKPPAAAIGGAKLQFSRDQSGRVKPDASAYLTFTVNEQPVLPAVRLRKKKKNEPLAACCHFRDEVERPLVVAAFDLGVRHLAAAAILEASRSEKWTVRLKDRLLIPEPSASLREVSRHGARLRRLKRKSGKPVKGERFAARFQDHITAMKKDRVKKGARAIVDCAAAHGAHVIVLEDLERYLPTAEDERWANRQLRRWNHRAIFEWIKMLAETEGFMVWVLNPYATSRMCSRCGARGARWSMRSKAAALAGAKRSWHRTLPRNRGPYPSGESVTAGIDYDIPVLDNGGHLFICFECGYRAQADMNAAINIGKKFFGRFNAPPGGTLKADSPESRAIEAKFAAWAAEVKQRRQSKDGPPAPKGGLRDIETPW